MASNIRQTIGLQKGAELSSSLTNMVRMMENVDVDSFLEVEDMHGMSAKAYGTMEMIEMHKSLKEGFSFEHSPILEDLKSLKEIPENKVLSPSELKQHREDVSVLLEKAMSSSSMGVFGKAMEGIEQGPQISPKRPRHSAAVNERVGPLAVNNSTVVQIKTTRAEENAYAIRMESMSAHVLRKVPLKSSV